ncbi:unnamed protein product [Jaminaea pallidilutea]
MGDSGYRGVSAESDPRYRNKETKQIKQLASKGAFPANFDSKVDLRKVNLSVMKPWIEGKVNELLGFEDEVVAEYVFGILESDEMRPFPNPRKLQLSLTGFLESSTPTFTSELWTLLLSAQDSVGGIPKEFVEKKKEEMRLARQRDAEAIRAAGQSRPLPGEQRGNARRSRWDDGSGAQAQSRQHFRDKSGNMTERSRDGGWGARGGGGPSRTYGGEIESSSASRAPQRDRYAERMQAGRDDGPARLEAARPRVAKPAAAAEEEEEQDRYRRRSRDRYEHRRSHRGDDSDAEGEQRKRERRDRSPQYGRESRDAMKRHRSRSPRYGRSSYSPPARSSNRQPQRGGRRYADGGSSSEEEQHRRGSSHRSRRRSADYEGRESPRGASGSRVHAQGRSFLSRDDSHEEYSSPERYSKSSKPSRREHDNGRGRAEGRTSSPLHERRSRSVSRSTRSYSSSESNA